MERRVGTVARGIRTPIIREGDDLAKIVVDSVLEAAQSEGFALRDRDVIALTESIVARAQGNYVDITTVAIDVKSKISSPTVGLVFPILSRNRFAIILKGIAKAVKKIVLMLSYPSDEVGNALISYELLDAKKVNPANTLLDTNTFRKLFGYSKHEFTGIDYIDYYTSLIKEMGAEAEIIFSYISEDILKYTKQVIACDVHTRKRTKALLKNKGAEVVLGLDDLLTKPINGSGFNPDYGLLGSNKSTEESLKLFPREAEGLLLDIQKQIFKKCEKKVEVMVYGDGAFKDPQGKIWELADPVVSPSYTAGLKGTPNELKLKYLADNDYKNLKGQELEEALKTSIKNKKGNLVGQMASQGTTPRQLTDLLGSLCDLVSGSGDKGTPVVLIQGYFDNYSD